VCAAENSDYGVLHSEHLTMMCLITKALVPPESFTLQRGPLPFPPLLLLFLPRRVKHGELSLPRARTHIVFAGAGLGLAQLNWEYLNKVQNRALEQALDTHLGKENVQGPLGEPTGLDYTTFAHCLLSVADAWAGKPTWENYVAFLSCLYNRTTTVYVAGPDDESLEPNAVPMAPIFPHNEGISNAHYQKQNAPKRTWLHIDSIRLCPHHNHEYFYSLDYQYTRPKPYEHEASRILLANPFQSREDNVSSFSFTDCHCKSAQPDHLHPNLGPVGDRLARVLSAAPHPFEPRPTLSDLHQLPPTSPLELSKGHNFLVFTQPVIVPQTLALCICSLFTPRAQTTPPTFVCVCDKHKHMPYVPQSKNPKDGTKYCTIKHTHTRKHTLTLTFSLGQPYYPTSLTILRVVSQAHAYRLRFRGN
jgi:hypothetical protein